MRRALIPCVAALAAVAVIGGPDMMAYVSGARPANRKQLYRIRQGLSEGMTREELERLITANSAVRAKWSSQDRVVLSVPTGFLEKAFLEIEVAQNHVVHGRVRGYDGRTIQDAPPDF
jgi:hypothetical protein